MAESDWRSLHPASVLVNLIPTAWRAIRSMWPLVLALVWGGRGADFALFEVGILGVLLGLPVWRTVVHWATLRYRVSEGRLEITSGVLNRQARVIAPERIQNVEMVRNVFHRLSGLVELRVETASGTEVEGSLSALSEAEASRLMDALQAGRGRPSVAEVDEVPLVVNGPGDLLRYGLSTARLGLVVVALGALYELAITSDPMNMSDAASMLGLVGSGTVLITLVLGAWLVGAATALMRHWGFRLLRLGDRLVAEEGLFTRRRVELAVDKVQLVTLSEPIVRRWLGFGSIYIETAALREGTGGTATSEAVIPVLDVDRHAELVRVALPDAPDLTTLVLSPPHPRALRRALGATAVRNSLLAAGLSWGFWPWGLLATALVPVGLFSAWLDHRMQGWWIGPGHVVSRTGWWVRTTRIVARGKLQSLELVQGPIARRWDLARLHLRVAGSDVALPMLSFEQALDLELDLSRSVAVALAASPPGVRPLLADHQPAREQQGPGDRLLHETHQDQAVEQHPGAAQPVEGPGGGREPRDGAEHHGEHPAQEQDPRHRVPLAVEPELPGEVDPDLEHDQRAVEHHQRADDDVQRGDQGPDGGPGERPIRGGDDERDPQG
jgi:putative membrane protein